MDPLSPDSNCTTCGSYVASACQVYPREAISRPELTTCNEHRPAQGAAWHGREAPPPGLGVFDVRRRRDGVQLRLRPPRREAQETVEQFVRRLGVMLRTPSQHGGHAVVAEVLAAEGPAAFEELWRTARRGPVPVGRLLALDALLPLTDPRLPPRLLELLDEEPEQVRVRALSGLARLGVDTPATREAAAALRAGSRDDVRDLATQATLLLDDAWTALRAAGLETGEVQARRREFRAQGALLGLAHVLADDPEAGLLREAFARAVESALHADAHPETPADQVAYHALRAAAPPPGVGDAVAAALALPLVLRYSGERAVEIVRRAAARAPQAPTSAVAAALASASLVCGAVHAEHLPDRTAALEAAHAACKDVHPGFARVLRSVGTPTSRRMPTDEFRFDTVAAALAVGLTGRRGLLQREDAGPDQRACSAAVAGSREGTLGFPPEWLETPLAPGLRESLLELARRCAPG